MLITVNLHVEKKRANIVTIMDKTKSLPKNTKTFPKIYKNIPTVLNATIQKN